MANDTKACRKCGVTKSIDDFYVHKMMADGHLSFCKECVKARVAAHREANLEAIQAYDRARYQEPGRHARSYQHAKSTRARHPEKARARTALRRAVKSGAVKREPCKVCGSRRVQGHHEDYSKPLDVVWLCFKHHMEVHGKVVLTPSKAPEGPVL